jgi:MFS family permease
MLPGPRATQRVRLSVILAVVSLAALAYAVLSSAVIPALPALQRGLHASETGVAWLLTGFLLSASVGTAIIGKLGDMYGKRRLLVYDMAMMRVRGVWTANLAAFLIGAGLYSCFLPLPQFAQLPRSTGFGYGASVVAAGLYLLPCALGMAVLGTVAGQVQRRFSARRALIAGAAVSAFACGWLAITSWHPYDMLLSSTLLGIGIGLAFATLGNLVVQAVPAEQTGVATGMNTVLRTLGGAIGGQIAATFVAAHMVHGLPVATGFTRTFAMSAVVLAGCVVAGLLVPARALAAARGQPAASSEPG